MGLFANGPSLLPGRDMPTVSYCPVVVAGNKTAGLRWRHLHWVYWWYAKRGRTNVCGNQLISAECNWQLAQFCRWRQTGCLHGTTHSLSRCWPVLLWRPVYVGINQVAYSQHYNTDWMSGAKYKTPNQSAVGCINEWINARMDEWTRSTSYRNVKSGIETRVFLSFSPGNPIITLLEYLYICNSATVDHLSTMPFSSVSQCWFGRTSVGRQKARTPLRHSH